MSTLEHAIAIAAKAHAGQMDKASAPYILHPLRVMLAQTDEPARIAAVLHDVVEDTSRTLEGLRQEGFSEAVLEAVSALTRSPQETYEAFIQRAGQNDLARRVKLGDLEDNMDLDRIANPTERDYARIEKYRRAKAALMTAGQAGRPTISRRRLFSSESVSAGHPDKLADALSDAILDRFLVSDPESRVACEAFVTPGRVILAGEFGTELPGLVDDVQQEAPSIVRKVLGQAGYDGSFPGIDPDGCDIQAHFRQQSEDIRRGVMQEEGRTGAGDQGMMFGYATDESPDYLPLPLSLAHQMMRRQDALRRSGRLSWLRPDAKAQVTVRYENGVPEVVHTVVLSTQHSPEVSDVELKDAVISELIEPVIPERLRAPDIKYLVNPTGRFELGGPVADTGLTGRKIIVDTYGGACPHGGGAFSGKDPTKVDRSGAYMARYIARNIVAAGLAKRCTIQLAYAIGFPEPVSLYVDTHSTGTVEDAYLEQAIPRVFDLTPDGIISELALQRPIYRPTATFGHFGNPDYPWEQNDYAEVLKAMR